MSLLLPPASSALRSLFDVAQLAALASPAGRAQLSTLPQARTSAAAFMAAEPSARSVQSLVLRANGDLALMRFGPRGGKSVLWNFGRL